MRLDNPKGNFSPILHSFKRNYTLNYKKTNNILGSFKLWQNRFWDHIIRDEKDLHQHFDYIHWNPVKHGVVQDPEDWTHSTFRHWQLQGYYDLGWGKVEPPQNVVNLSLE
jgi:putative transposase